MKKYLTDFQFDIIRNQAARKGMALTLDRILELLSAVTPLAVALFLVFTIHVPVVPQECMRSAVFGHNVGFHSPVRHGRMDVLV